MTPSAESPPASRFAGKRVHFIGIGGAGMAGLASILIDNGAIVSGSEPSPNEQTDELRARGAKISREQLGKHLDSTVTLVIRTAAVTDANIEVLVAAGMRIRTIKYAELLGEVMAERFGIAVSGTHGKSTTSAMIAHALLSTGTDPSFLIGGTVPQLGGSSRSGQGGTFVAEACEYDRSFHALHPRVAVITNIEADHLDCYKDLDDIISSFRKFVRNVPTGGKVIAGADANVFKTLTGTGVDVELCALRAGFVWSTIAVASATGWPAGDVYHKGNKVAELRLSVPGEHNLMNATVALAACNAAGLAPEKAAAALNTFTGVDRRMTNMGPVDGIPGGATVVDDYGHHPTEIRATLTALKTRYRPRKLICVFQPHQHSRTRLLLDDFAISFAQADDVIIPDIYAVRDSDDEKKATHARDLVERIIAVGNEARYIPAFADIANHVRATAAAGDLVVTMGAGTIGGLAKLLVGDKSAT